MNYAVETLTPRERWLAVLRREQPDRIPMDYWATPEATVKLKKYLNCETEEALLARLHIDRVISAGPKYKGPPLPKDTDTFGCQYKEVNYGTGNYSECVYHPLAQYKSVEEIKQHYKWPEEEWWDYASIKEEIKGFEDYPICGGGSEPFLIYKKLRGQEQGLMDLILYPEIAHYCLDRLFSLAYTNTLRIYESIPGRVMISYVAEDMGGQEELMYSPEQIRKFLLPGMKRMIDLARQAGVYVFHHNDGAIRSIIPEMIGMGIDVLNPIQWRCKGMEREGLKRDFGDKLIFHGGVDNQYTLPFGSVDEVKQEVLDNLKILGKGGGYILAPCHNIQAVSPPENIVAMYETGYQYGWG